MPFPSLRGGKSVSFAAAHDPALFASSEPANERQQQQQRRRQCETTNVHTEASLAAVHGRRRGAEGEIGKKNERKKAMLRMSSAAAASPSSIHVPTALGASRSLAERSLGEITEPIDNSSSEIVATASTAYVVRQERLAVSLAREDKQRADDERARVNQTKAELERRTLYGSAKRKLERQSRRLSRTVHAVDVDSTRTMSVRASSSVENDLAPYDVKSLPSSQELHISHENGAYQTQFSFYRFNDEEECSEECDTTNRTALHSSNPDYGDEKLHGSATPSGYEAGESASNGTSLAHSLDSALEENSLPKREAREHFVPVYRPVFATQSESHEDEDVALGNLLAPTLLPNNEIRCVYPTVWRGAAEIQKSFEPLLDAYTPLRSPPARADLSRWADWMDSQSDRVVVVDTANLFEHEESLSTWSERQL